jgi:hypothetical protein
MARALYATREEVKTALDFKQGAAANQLIDQKLADSCDQVDKLLNRRFYPYLGTRSWDWPTAQTPRPWRLWLDDNEMCSPPSSMSSGGVAIDVTTVIPYPNWALQRQEPITHLELNVNTTSAFSAAQTWQNSITATSIFGYSDVQIPAGAIPAGGITSSATTVNLGVSGCRGVGSILLVDSERMLVTERRSVDSGTTLQGNLTANNANNLIPVADPTQYSLYETLTIDGEQMWVEDTVGANLLVKRAWNGTPLAAHSTGASIYAQRLLTVTRGALGTIPAAHSANTVVTEHDAPGMIRQLVVSDTIVNLIQTRAGYPAARGRSSGGGGQTGSALAVAPSDLAQAWQDAIDAFGRNSRIRTT